MRSILGVILSKLRLRKAEKKTVPEEDCLARKYAGCHDHRHCPYCDRTEQALRAATRFDDGV